MQWKAGTSPATGETGWISEGGQFRKEKPTSEEAPADRPDRFPHASELESGTVENLKESGIVRKVTTPSGEYVVKDANDSAASKFEVLASVLARHGAVNLPAAKLDTVSGKPSIVQEFVQGDTVRKLGKSDPEELKRRFKEVPRADVDRAVLFDYLLGNTDVHNGNYMLTPGNRLYSIDKEMILGRGNLRSQRYEPHAFLSNLTPDGSSLTYQFDRESVKGMAEAGRRMAAELLSAGLRPEAKQLADRVVVLEEMARRGSFDTGTLYRLGAKGVAPPDLGLFGKIAWHLTKG